MVFRLDGKREPISKSLFTILRLLQPEQIKTFRGLHVDFSAKAERRGVERGAVELALNLLATNQEQHRPRDRFRRLQLPPVYQPPPEEVPLWKPLEPWERPVELDPLHYTKLIRKFRRWKEHSYDEARNQMVDKQGDHLQPPFNYNGPFTLPSFHNVQQTAKQRLNYLSQIRDLLLNTRQAAPRPLVERLCELIGEGPALTANQSHPLQDNIPLREDDLDLLKLLGEDSWALDEKQDYADHPAGFPDQGSDFDLAMRQLEELEKDLLRARIGDNDAQPLLPFWRPTLRQRADPSSNAYFIQERYDKGPSSQPGKPLREVLERINIERLQRETSVDGISKKFKWEVGKVQHYIDALHDAGRIQ